MINPHDIVQRTPSTFYPRALAVGGISGVVDTEGAAWALIKFCVGSCTTGARFYARCCSAAATSFANATAFGTVIDTSTIETSNRTYAYLVNMRTAGKRFIRVKCSAIGTSAKIACFVDLHWNKLVPPTDITGSAPFSSFFAFTVVE